MTEFPKRDLVPLNNFDKTLMFNCASFRHFVQEGNEFGIQEGLLLNLLDTKFHLLPVQNGGMTSD